MAYGVLVAPFKEVIHARVIYVISGLPTLSTVTGTTRQLCAAW